MAKVNFVSYESAQSPAQLFIKQPNSRYRLATDGEVIQVARDCVGNQIGQGDILNSPDKVRCFLTLWLADRPYEVFAALFLDNQNRLLSAEELFRGTLSQTAVYPREVARRALELNAGGILITHNHPSGLDEASHADRLLTDTLRQTLQLLEIRVLDHIIVAGKKTMSFAEHGLL